MLTTPEAPPGRATVPLARRLAEHGDAAALITRNGTISYRELAARVQEVVDRLGPTRRLVLVAGANDIDSLVVHLAALSAGHPVLLAPGSSPAAVDALVAAYSPDVVARGCGGAWRLEEQREGTAHALHPDLALLLSTSGSTGSPKLVRLSHENLQSNAESIAAYLGIRPTDRAATTLPLHYSYGLSVVHSHLLRGAGLILTDLSVVDACFWDLFRQHGGTSFAGVPHTFELLDRVGFPSSPLPHLRYVTCAGGRLAPDRVTRYARLGQRHGWDLFVMYGQTEATARMAYLPPDLAPRHPASIGVPVPGGRFRLEPLPDGEPGTGELVYAGPNVMLGYAERPEDLARGRDLDELRTGDVARRTDDGLYEVVGRLSRFVKVFGLRIDLGRVEAALEEAGIRACCAAADDELGVVAEGAHDADAEEVRARAAQAAGLPPRVVRVRVVDTLPRLATGKPDGRAVTELVREATGSTEAPAPESGAEPRAALTPTPRRASDGPSAAELRDLYAEVLERPDATEDSTFVGLGGDSLSYVEMSLRLEELLGHLPSGWHTTPVRDLVPGPRRRRRRRGQQVETSVLLRAAAIVLVVGSHADLMHLVGGAHVLLAVAGFNLARFHLTSERRERTRNLLRSAARIAVPTVAWVAGVALLTDHYSLVNVLLLNLALGPEQLGPSWELWFVEALVVTLLAVGALLRIPAVSRWERRAPFGFAVALVLVGLLTRFEAVVLGGPDRHHSPHVLFWIFAIGWAAAKATGRGQRALVSVLAVATVPGFFADPRREAVVVAGVLLLLWTSSARVPAPLAQTAAVLANSSLYVYVTHWMVFPHLEKTSPLLAVLASFAVGIAYWKVAGPAVGRLTAPRGARSRSSRRASGVAAAPTVDVSTPDPSTADPSTADPSTAAAAGVGTIPTPARTPADLGSPARV